MLGDICFYADADFFSRIIEWRTGGSYSHVCVDVGNNKVIEANYPHVKLDVIGHPVKVYTPVLNAHKRQEAIDWLYTTIGDSYDVLDILANIWSIILPDTRVIRTPTKFICSELTAYYLRKAGYLFPRSFHADEKSMSLVTPNGLARVLGVL